MEESSDREAELMHLQIGPDHISYSGPQSDYSILELTSLYREHSRQQRINRLWQGLSVMVPWFLGLLVVAIAVFSLAVVLTPNQPQQQSQIGDPHA